MTQPTTNERSTDIHDDARREDVARLPRKLETRYVNSHRYEVEIRRYYEDRLARMNIVRTTKSPHGQVIDWIPRESQLRRGQGLAAPPPCCNQQHEVIAERPDRRVRFELEDPKVDRGPEGTVPVLRKNLDAIRFSQPLRKLLGKYPYADFVLPRDGRLVPAPTIAHKPPTSPTVTDWRYCASTSTTVSATTPDFSSSNRFAR